MKILAIDTSSKICSTAILEDDKIMDEMNLDNGTTHSENLMPMVAEILEKNHLKLAQMDLLSCCIGPRLVYGHSHWCSKRKSDGRSGKCSCSRRHFFGNFGKTR